MTSSVIVETTDTNVIEVIAPGGPPGPAGPPGATTLMELTDVTGAGGNGQSPVDDGSGSFPLTRIVTQDDLDAILAAVAHVDWRPLQLTARFAPYGAGFADPAYRLTLNNVVHCEGLVLCNPPLSDADTGMVVAQFAPDACPNAKLLFGCPAFGNNARFDVESDGTMTFEGMLVGGGMIDWFTLTSISYSVGAAQSAVARDALASVFA